MQHRDRDSGRSEQLNDDVRPHGRFSFSIATCGSRVLMVGGGTDYRVAADETWVWEPTIRTVENPEEAAGRTGHWTRVYGNGPFDDMAAPRPRGAGPLRPVAFAIANQDQLGASDIYLFGGVNNQSAGLFIHKGFETSEMWRWRCTPQSWPDARRLAAHAALAAAAAVTAARRVRWRHARVLRPLNVSPMACR